MQTLKQNLEGECPGGHSLTPLNHSLLRDLVAWAAEDHARLTRLFDGEWEQDHWSQKIVNGVCQTSYCIAGQAVVQAGYGLQYEEDYDEDDNLTVWSAVWCAPQYVVGVDTDGTLQYELDEERLETIEDVGRRVLGLTRWEASCLFYAGNDLAQVARIANDCAERRGLPPVYEATKER